MEKASKNSQNFKILFKILIVEDNPDIIYFLEEYIKDYLESSSVKTLGDAIKYLESNNVDAIILDLNLPDSKGIDTLKEISYKFPEMPVVIFSGIDDTYVIHQAIQGGAQDYLIKLNVDQDTLLRTINYAIERKKIQTKLKEKEEVYESLFEGCRDAVFIIRIETGTILDINNQAQKLLKKSRDQIVGKHHTTLYPKDQTNIAVSAFNEFANKLRNNREIPGPIYLDIITSENELIPVEINSCIITLPKGERIVQSIYRDITDRKKIDEKLKESEYKWRSLTENSAEYIVQTDLEGNIQFANRNGNFSRENAIGRSIYENIPDHNKITIRDCMERVKNGKKSDICYTEYFYKNETKIFESHITPFIRSDKVVGFIISSLDITRRKQAEDALRESEEKYRTIVENSNDMIWLVDADGKYIFFNKKAERLSGYTSEELKGKIFAPLVLKDDQQKVLDIFSNVLKGQIQHYDFSYINKFGKKITVSANSVPIYSDGKIVGVSSFGRDITEQKQFEEEIKRTREQLLKSNREIEQFAYIASHDLQEPLRSISSFTELLSSRYKGHLDSEADDFIEYILSGTKRMKEMINDLLTLSRVKTREKPFNKTNISDVINQALLNLHNLIITNHAKITIGYMPIIYGDQSQLIQLFQNLIDNAIKFRKKNHSIIPKLDISAKEGENEWIFSVKDNGIGIDPKNFNKLFTIFTRLHGKDEYPGTGIGLAICKKIVERHNGEIWVESKLGEGSTFYFSIPTGAG